MQTQFLQRYAPNSLHLLFHPLDTGNPNFDFNSHLEKFANRRIDAGSVAPSSHHALDASSVIPSDPEQLKIQALYTGNISRIDLESIQLVGGRILGRVEIDLGPVDEAEKQYKILTVPYAEKQLGHIENAIEFIRVIKQAVSAGVEADPRSLQIWASWGYREIRNRHSQYMAENPTASADDISTSRSEIIGQVLKELALIAMALTDVTSTKENRQLDEPETVELYSSRDQQLTPHERQNLFELRCEEILFDHETTAPFAAELKVICSKLPRSHSSGVVHDDEAQFQSYLTSLADSGTGEQDLEALFESHERVTEQYSEGGVVSLHMSESERFVVDGTLDDDVTEEYLPTEARSIAHDIQQFYINGEALDVIDSFIEFSLNKIYGDPSDKSARVGHTNRAVSTRREPTRRRPDGSCHQSKPVGTRPAIFEYTYRTSVYPNREERQYVCEVLDILLERMQRDFILNSMNSSAVFRAFYNQIDEAADLGTLIATIQAAFQARRKKTISIKMFTALNTLYNAKRSRVESTPAKIQKTVNGRKRTFIPAIPIIEMAKTIPPRKLRKLASSMHTLPTEERERVSRILRAERPELYARIQDGLLDIIEKASQAKRGYLRFAFYLDRKSGKPNEPHNLIHLLSAADTALVWQQLKTSSGIAEPATRQPGHKQGQHPQPAMLQN